MACQVDNADSATDKGVTGQDGLLDGTEKDRRLFVLTPTLPRIQLILPAGCTNQFRVNKTRNDGVVRKRSSRASVGLIQSSFVLLRSSE